MIGWLLGLSRVEAIDNLSYELNSAREAGRLQQIAATLIAVARKKGMAFTIMLNTCVSFQIYRCE